MELAEHIDSRVGYLAVILSGLTLLIVWVAKRVKHELGE
jgi:hypothetical protein